MTRKLSVISSQYVGQFLGTSLRRKFSIAMLKSLNVAQHLLWVVCLCINPHNRSIGLRCGE